MAETFVTVYQGAGGRVDLGYDYTQDITNNKTTLTVKAYVVKTNSSYYSYRLSPQTFTLTVNGTATTYAWTFDFRQMTLNARYLITTAVREITHNADGTKSSITASVYCSTGTEGLGVVSGSTSITISTIPRASTPTLSATTTAIGSAVTINTNRASTSFTHAITYSFGSASGTIATGIGTSYSWTLPASLANQIPNTTSGSGSIKLKTYSGTTLIGEKSIAFTATVPDTSAFQPTASGLTAFISGSGRDKTIGKYVQSISKVYMSFSSTANGGATIKSNSINIKKGTSTNSMTVNGTSGTSGTVTSSGVYTITATTADSRGRSKSTSITIIVEAYAVPKITSFTASRQSTTKTSVSTVRNGNYTYMNDSNPLSVVIARRPRGGSYTNLNTTAGTTSGTFLGTYVSTGNSETSSYDFKLTITDSFGNSAVSEITVPTSSVALSIAGDVGIGVGKVWEQGALDVGGNIYSTGSVYLNGGVTARFIPSSIPSNSNLNDFTTPGMYYNGSNASVATLTNCPTSSAFSLFVERHAGVKQTLTIYTSTSVVTYIRNYYSGNWGTWRQVFTADGSSVNSDKLDGYHALSFEKSLTMQSTSSGWYIKFDSGLLICHGIVNLEYFNNKYYHASFTAPHAFYGETPRVAVIRGAADINSSVNSLVYSADTTMTSAYIRGWSVGYNTITGFSLASHVVMIGRWK